MIKPNIALMENMAKGSSGPHPHMIIDLGYLKHPETEKRGEFLSKIVGKSNMFLGIRQRVMAYVRPRKQEKVKEECMGLREGGGYFGASHNWVPDGASDLALIKHIRERH